MYTKLRSFFKLFAIFCIFIAALFLVPHLFTFNNLRDDVAEKIFRDTKVHTEIFGNIKIAILPSMKIMVSNATIKGPDFALDIPLLNLKINALDLLKGVINITGIEIGYCQFTLQALEYLREILAAGGAKDISLLNNVAVSNVSLVLNTHASSFSKIQDISGNLAYQYKKRLKFNGNFAIDKKNYNSDIILHYDSNQNSSAVIESEFIKIVLNANIKDNNDLTGTINASLKNAPLSSGDKLYERLINDNMHLDGDVILSNNAILLSNLAISGKEFGDLKGSAEILLGEIHKIKSNLVSESVNIDILSQTFSDYQKKQRFTIENIVKSILLSFNFDIPSNIDAFVNVSIKNILHQNHAMKSFLLNAKASDGKVYIDELSVFLPGDAYFGCSGMASHNKIRPKFDGKIEVKIANYNAFNSWIKIDEKLFQHLFNQPLFFTSTMSLMPRNLKIDNISLKWGDLSASGKTVFKYSGDDKITSKGVLRINHIDTDSLNLSNKIDDFITNLYAYDIDKSGEKFRQLTNDFHWLRSFPIHLDGEIYIDSLGLKKIKMDKFSTYLKLSPNFISVENLSINSEKAEILGNISLSTSAITPKFEVDLNIPKFDVEFLDGLLPSIDVRLQAIQNAFKEFPELNSLTNRYNFYGLRHVVADCKIKIGNLLTDKIAIRDVSSEIKVLDGIAQIKDLKAKIFNGELELVGNVVFSSLVPIYNASFAINNINFAAMTNYLYGNNNSPFSGYSSISAVLDAKGSNIYDIYENIRGKLKFIGRNIWVNGFDIGEIMHLSEQPFDTEYKQRVITGGLTSGKSLFDEVIGDAVLNAGVLSVKDMQIRTPRISGAISLNFKMLSNFAAYFARLNFIPVGRRNSMSIDIVGDGMLGEIKNTYNYEQYWRFLTTDPVLNNKRSDTQVIPNGLRNF